MKRTKIQTYLILVPVLSLHACIEEYRPDIEAIESNRYVVFGELTTENENQIISVSLASSIREPKFMPLYDCKVSIRDKNGNSFEGSEFEEGKYKVRIPPENLICGMEYQLKIVTPASTILVSEYEKLVESPNVDSIYYVKEDKPTNDPEVFIEGIQFYLNLEAPDMENAFYKFDIIETYEYHSLFPLEWYYDGVLHHVDPPDYSHLVCWATEQIKDIFILNTDELQDNAFKQFHLHFVDNTSQRLEHLYSLLVKQYTISKHAYVYWDQLRANNMEQGGMYETQPLPVTGNVVNLTNPKQSVLGYFQVLSVKTKRIFVKNVPDLEFQYEPDCGIWPPERLQFYEPWQYPVYFSPSLAEVSPECIFCDMSIAGGTISRPDFWPQQK